MGSKFLSACSFLLLFSVAVALGVWFGPWARMAVSRLSPPVAFDTGDFSALYRDTAQSVVLFSTSTCPYCARARDLLEREQVSYRDFVVDRDPQALQRFQRLGGGPVPVVYAGDRRIVGFNEAAIRAALSRVRDRD